MTNLMSVRSTKLEQQIADKICAPDFPFNEKFIKISQMLLRRIARRYERIRLNKMIKADFNNGFKRKNYPNVTQFEK